MPFEGIFDAENVAGFTAGMKTSVEPALKLDEAYIPIFSVSAIILVGKLVIWIVLAFQIS